MTEELSDKKIIQYIKVNGLNGFLNHSIELREEGATIIYGPNGSGKTTFLKIIYALFNKDFLSLCEFKFNNMEIKFSNGENLNITKIIDKDRKNSENLTVLRKAMLGHDNLELSNDISAYSILFTLMVEKNEKILSKVTLSFAEIERLFKKSENISPKLLWLGWGKIVIQSKIRTIKKYLKMLLMNL